MRHAPAPPPTSSAVTIFRAAFMLVCLIGIPIIALRGTAASGTIRQFVIEKLGGSVPESTAHAGTDEAPAFVPPQVQLPEMSPSVGSTGSATSNPSFSEDLAPAYPGPAAAPAQTLSYDSSQFSASRDPVTMPATLQPGSASRSGPARDAVLANYDSPQDLRATAGRTLELNTPAPASYGTEPSLAAAAPNGPVRTDPDTLDQFAHIQKRLRELGSTYFLLENWGDQGECYRFHCRVAVDGNPNFTKHFEATDPQLLGAMTQVLGEVEAWRRGSTPQQPLPASPYPPIGSQTSRSLPVQDTSPHGPYSR